MVIWHVSNSVWQEINSWVEPLAPCWATIASELEPWRISQYITKQSNGLFARNLRRKSKERRSGSWVELKQKWKVSFRYRAGVCIVLGVNTHLNRCLKVVYSTCFSPLLSLAAMASKNQAKVYAAQAFRSDINTPSMENRRMQVEVKAVATLAGAS